MAKSKRPEVSGLAPNAASEGVLKLRLGKCLDVSNRRLYHGLNAVALALIRVRNRMARSWQRLMEDGNLDTFPQKVPLPGTTAEQLATLTVGERVALQTATEVFSGHIERLTPRVIHLATTKKRNGEVTVTRTQVPRADVLALVSDLSTWLYHRGRDPEALTPAGALPLTHLASQLISAEAQAVLKRLKTPTPYTHPGQAEYRWQAVLYNEINLDSARSLTIPVPRMETVFAYHGSIYCGGSVPRSIVQRALVAGAGGCALAFVLWSGSAGRRERFHVCRIAADHLPEGLQAVLRRIASGAWKFCDSELVFHKARPNSMLARDGKDGEWFLHLTYQQPGQQSTLDAGRHAVLRLQDAECKHPFRVQEPAARAWEIGRGPLIRKMFAHLEARRTYLKEIYRVTGSGRRGHGHGRVHRDVKPLTRRGRETLNDVLHKTAAEIVRFCVRYDCGTLEWLPPAMSYRPRCWFPHNGVPWDWALFLHALKHECWQGGVQLIQGTAPARQAPPRNGPPL